MSEIRDYLRLLQPDPWRERVGFSPEMAEANERLFDPTISAVGAIEALKRWVHRHQPCLFGRMAAKLDLISYCILSEADLDLPDDQIQKRIQTARTKWTRDGFLGQKNAFIILAISRRIAYAVPDENVKAIALRLASMYLLCDVVPDQVFHDRIWLEMPGQNRLTWEWYAGVNYFSAQGDRRWWQDHRIPGGMAFSVNSVGHMVKSGMLARALAALTQAMGAPDEALRPHNVSSLTTALELAMRTIANASDTVSGKATGLFDLPTEDDGKPTSRCPVALSGDLQLKDSRQYTGYYHTDYTVPTEYFRDAVERPADVPAHILDFTYLYESGVQNPAYDTMGSGRQIREDADLQPPRAGMERERRVVGRVTEIDQHERLFRALA